MFLKRLSDAGKFIGFLIPAKYFSAIVQNFQSAVSRTGQGFSANDRTPAAGWSG